MYKLPHIHDKKEIKKWSISAIKASSSWNKDKKQAKLERKIFDGKVYKVPGG